ncbi:MAG: endo-1,4-beta-xylanase [Actinomycetota bacterium]
MGGDDARPELSSDAVEVAPPSDTEVSAEDDILVPLIDDGAPRLRELAELPIGATVAAGTEYRSVFDVPATQQTVVRHFDTVTAENIMKMRYLHPEQDRFDFEEADRLVDWARANDIDVHGHTFIWHADYQIPEWMLDLDGDWNAMMDDHVETIAAHFAGRVASWDVVNEAFADDGGYRDTLFLRNGGPEYLPRAFLAARRADPEAELYYNDYGLECNQVKLDEVLAMVDRFAADGTPIDGIGVQMHVQLDWPELSCIEDALGQLVATGLKIRVSEMDVPVNNIYNPDTPAYGELTTEAAERQRVRYREVLTTYLNVVPPDQRGGIAFWGVWDGDSWLLSIAGADDWPLLFGGPADGPYEPKPSFYAVVEALGAE